MDQDLIKAVTTLIDETLVELEELKKSDRFSAAEVKIEGPGSGIAGKDSNGELDKEETAKAEDEEELEEKSEEGDDDDEDEDKKKKKDEAKKAEDGANVEKAEDEAEKAESCDAPEMKKSETDKAEKLKKSHVEEIESLKKSYDAQLIAMTEQIESLKKSMEEIANTPVERKGIAYNNVEALEKSAPEVEPLNKSQVVDKLMEMKKSGEHVLTDDIISLDLGGPDQLVKIANKYGLK